MLWKIIIQFMSKQNCYSFTPFICLSKHSNTFLLEICPTDPQVLTTKQNKARHFSLSSLGFISVLLSATAPGFFYQWTFLSHASHSLYLLVKVSLSVSSWRPCCLLLSSEYRKDLEMFQFLLRMEEENMGKPTQKYVFSCTGYLSCIPLVVSLHRCNGAAQSPEQQGEEAPRLIWLSLNGPRYFLSTLLPWESFLMLQG